MYERQQKHFSVEVDQIFLKVRAKNLVKVTSSYFLVPESRND